MYKALIEKSPQASDIANLGALLRGTGRIKDAMLIYQNWVTEFAGTPELVMNAINCAIELGKIEEARRWLKIGQNKNPNNAILKDLKRNCLIKKGEKKKR